MTRYWSGVFAMVAFAATAVLGAQGNPPQANTPVPDTKAPAGVQRPTPAADAIRRFLAPSAPGTR